MAGLAATTRQLAELRRRWERRIAAGGSFRPARDDHPPAGTPLRRVDGFGSNPGALEMFAYVPETLAPRPALVVVLHGCTQNAATYDAGSGWSALAEEYGFVLVYPQQNRANNPKSCFSWFLPGDTARDRGEAHSIRQMVEHAAIAHSVDRSRIFVTGLSAGGAMAAAMLATYPDVFAAGGVVAGLPYGAAANVQEALRAMSQPTERPARVWGDMVRDASPSRGPWPRLSVWHGEADTIVRAGNARELVKQWTNLHDLPSTPSASHRVDGHVREVWRDRDGREIVESFTIVRMGHGTPLRVGEADGMGGAAGPFMLDVGISSSHRMAAFWGLTEAKTGRAHLRPAAPAPRHAGEISTKVLEGTVLPREEEHRTDRDRHGPARYIESVIDGAFRAAGLRR